MTCKGIAGNGFGKSVPPRGGGTVPVLNRNSHRKGKTMKKLKNILAGFYMALVAITYATDSAAEEPNLLDAKSIMCNFDKGTVAEFDGADVKVSFANFGEDNAVSFTSIDLGESRAIVRGSSENAVAILLTPTGLTFIEKTGVGNFIFTTVYLTPQADGSFPAVTSRHIDTGIFGSRPLPSQYYGICAVAE